MNFNPFSLTSTEARAGRILMKLNLPVFCSGFTYLCIAIAETYKDPSIADYVTKSLAPRVAKICNRGAASVHRAMVRAVEHPAQQPNPEMKKLYLGSADVKVDILVLVRKVAEFLHLEDEGKVIQ